MSEMYMMITITKRLTSRKIHAFYEQNGLSPIFCSLANGTATSEMLDYFGLEATEKIVMMSVVTDDTWKGVKRGLEEQVQIDVPGRGIAFLIPLSSIGGKKALFFLTEKQNFQKGEESTLKNTKYELLIVIANQGYTGMIMDAARKAEAGGGTVIHAKGVGMAGAENFLGVSLVNEREMVFIVVKSEIKNAVMKSIMENAGLESKAQSILFTLPVTSTAGMRLLEESKNDDDIQANTTVKNE